MTGMHLILRKIINGIQDFEKIIVWPFLSETECGLSDSER